MQAPQKDVINHTQELVMNNRKCKNKQWIKRIILFLFLIAYVGIHLFIAFRHEAWRDESQAWIIARNCSFLEILGICASEGHPCLWFFMLKLCQICGMSYYHISIISVVIMTCAAIVLLYNSPFSLYSIPIIVLSPIFFYYNPVICRVYCIVVLLFLLLCAWWPKRRNSPITYGIIVALLFQSHILVAGLAIGCLVEIVYDWKGHLKRKNIIGFLIPFSSLICMLFELKQTDNTETYLHITPSYIVARLGRVSLKEMVFSITNHFDYMSFHAGIVFLCMIVVIMVVFTYMLFKYREVRKELSGIGIVSLCGIVYYFGIIIFIRNAAHIQMAIILWLIVFFSVWTTTITLKGMWNRIIDNKAIIQSNKHAVKETIACYSFEFLFVICCVLVIPRTAWIDPIIDIKQPYSGGFEIANMIVDNVPDDSIIVVQNNKFCTSVIAYLYESDKNLVIWDIDNGQVFTIHKWGKTNERELNAEAIYEAICGDVETNETCYFVNCTDSLDYDDGFSDKMVLVGQNNKPNKWDEYYQLYRVDLE